jgi:hypothetical protein
MVRDKRKVENIVISRISIFYRFWTFLCLYEVFLPLEGLESMGMSKIQFSTLFDPTHDFTNF